MTDKILKNLNEVQRQAAQAIDGPVLVLAGAGSGKTRVLTSRIAYMVSQGIPPYHILAITFTNKAANEMKSRLMEMDCSAEMMTICTIHSLCVRILRQNAEKIGYERNFSIYDEQDSAKIIKDICKLKDADDDKLKKFAAREISAAKTHGLTPEEYKSELGGEEIIADIFARYNETLFKSNAMDFDDLLLNTYKLLRGHPDVLDYYQERFRYISIDEFQDVNKIQFNIFRLLSKKYQNLFVVGDDDQSIYSWRGADITNILNFSNDNPNAKVFKLEQNYRSTKKILEAANEIISHNLSRHDKKLWTAGDAGVRVELFTAQSESEEAAYVVGQICSLLRTGRYGYGDFAILMRINALSRVFEQECNRYRLPFKVYGGFKFFERKEIKDLTAYLRAVVNPSDNEAILRIINVPKRGIGETTQGRLRQMAEGRSMLNVLSDEEKLRVFNGGTRAKLAEFYGVYSKLTETCESLELVEFVKYLIDITNFRVSVADSDQDVEKNMNIDQFVQSVDDFAKENPGGTLDEYLQTMTLSPDAEAEEGETVTLATIHSAKGLEFGTVFVVGMDEGILPISRAMDTPSELEEERRLMYVAVTRAKERLYLTRSRRRFIYNSFSETIASRYFNEINDLLSPPKPQRRDADGVPEFEPRPRQARPNRQRDSGIYRVGNIVNHSTFGRGIILNIANGNADVIFDNAGKKTLALKYAPLEIIK